MKYFMIYLVKGVCAPITDENIYYINQEETF